MNRTALLAAIALSAFAADLEYTKEGGLVFPQDYREWVYLSSGLGMSYGPLSSQMPRDNPPFDNVFVSRASYKSFVETGKWPDKTIFVLELRTSQGKGSINQNGHFQTGVMAIEAEVKDEQRFPQKWAFFSFEGGAKTGKLFPQTASCYSCHAVNGAVDNTFVQFYPTLAPIAKEKGTFRKAGSIQ